MRGGGEAEREGQQRDARTPFAARALHRVGDSHGGVDEAVEPPHGEDFVVGRDGVADDGGAEAVEAEREEAALVAEEAARDPPEAAAEPDGEEDEGQMEQVLDAEELVAGLPGGAVERALGVEAVFGLAEACRRRA